MSNGLGLIGAGKRAIKTGNEFAPLYTKPAFNDKAEIKKGSVHETCLKIKELVGRWSHQTEKITKYLQLSDTNRKETAYKMWYYYHTYFQYTPDRNGVEELRSPRRSFWDRAAGVDCDCFSVSLSCQFHNIGATDAALKIIRRKGESDYSHIYMVWPKVKGTVNWDDKTTYYTIDPVVHTFNLEVDDIEEYKIYPLNSSAVSGLNGIDVVTLDGVGNDATRFKNDLDRVNKTGKTPNGYPPVAFAQALQILITDPSQINKAIELENLWQKAGYTGPLYFTPSVNGWASDLWKKVTSPVTKVIDVVKDQVSDTRSHTVAENAAHAAAIVPFTPARESIKQILKFNVFGLATLLDFTSRTDAKKYKEIQNVWYKYGGDETTLSIFINEGKTKVPRQVAPAVLNNFKIIKNLIETANAIHYGTYKLSGLASLGAAGADDAAAAGSVASSSTIWLEWGKLLLPLVIAYFTNKKTKEDSSSNKNPDPTNTGNDGSGNGGDGDKKETSYTVPLILTVVAAKLLIF